MCVRECLCLLSFFSFPVESKYQNELCAQDDDIGGKKKEEDNREREERVQVIKSNARRRKQNKKGGKRVNGRDLEQCDREMSALGPGPGRRRLVDR